MATSSVIELRPVDLCCISCADRVLAAVRAVPGVSVSHVSLDDQSGRLTVDLDAQLASETAVREAINSAGYRTDGDAIARSTGQLAHTTDMTPGHLLHSL